MELSIILQLATSFLIGGAIITLLSLLAEKANARISGIIMMFPSTVVLGFFFLGIATSADKVVSIIPSTLIPLGIVILSSVIYINIATLSSKFLKLKINQICLTFISTSIIWFLFAAPFAIYKITNLSIGITGYTLLILLAHYYLNREEVDAPATKFKYTGKQILFRASFVGTAIATVVFLGKTLDVFWGGLFTMYPAATMAILMVLHFYYEPKQLFHFFRKAPIGSLSILMYCISIMLLFPKLGIIWGTVSGVLICMTFSLLLIRIQYKKVKRVIISNKEKAG